MLRPLVPLVFQQVTAHSSPHARRGTGQPGCHRDPDCHDPPYDTSPWVVPLLRRESIGLWALVTGEWWVTEEGSVQHLIPPFRAPSLLSDPQHQVVSTGAPQGCFESVNDVRPGLFPFH